jgi:pSer/pThr/pTyr-binding forkhead associated (FHA) protein
MAWLDGVAGIVAGQRMVLSKEEMLLGRSGVCDMQFHDPKVSRQHAMVRLHDNHYFIQDMQSSRGTFINGKRIQTHQLQDRDQIQLGDTVLVFRRY